MRILFLFLIIVVSSCDKSIKMEGNLDEMSTTSNFLDKYNNFEYVKKMSNKIHLGDTIAFTELRDVYFLSSHKKEFLYYALTMAHSYNYHEAYYSVYRILGTDIINDKNKYQNKIANYYLLKSHEMGSKQAISVIKSRFSDHKFPTSTDYWKTIK